jgi:hypothetical protein
MRFALVCVALVCCSVVRAENTTEPKSVLVPTPAEAPTVASTVAPAPVTVIVEPAPVVVTHGRRVCTGPNCRLYNVEETVTETQRHRLFGGYVVRNNNRTVYRPATRWQR